MTSIRIPAFGGMNAALSERHIDGKLAVYARDTELRDGKLRAYQTPKFVTRAQQPVATIFKPPPQFTCGILTWPTCVSVVVPAMPQACAGFRLLGVFPEQGDEEAYFLDTDTMGRHVMLPEKPNRALSIRVDQASPFAGASHTSPDLRIYTYTWVTHLGIETAPAPPSNPLRVHDGAVISLTGFDTPPPGVGMMRLYRSSAEPEGYDEKTRLDFELTSFQLVAEWASDEVGPGVELIDSKMLTELWFGTLDTVEVCPAPIGLKSVLELDSGYYVGFDGNSIYVSERHEVWNWPEKNRIELPDTIIGLAKSQDMIFAVTSGRPAKVKITPTNEEVLGKPTFTTRIDVARAEGKYPGVSRHAIASTSFGCVYVSRHGLIMIPVSGDAQNVSRNRIDEDEWVKWAPNRIVWQNGRLFGTRGLVRDGFIMDLRAGDDGKADMGDLVEISMRARALHLGDDGIVYYAEDRAVMAWDQGDDLMSYVWRSKKFSVNSLTYFSAGKLLGKYGKDVVFTLYTFDDEGTRQHVFTRVVNSSKPFRIPQQRRRTEWQIELKGSAVIDDLHLATSIAELSESAQ